MTNHTQHNNEKRKRKFPLFVLYRYNNNVIKLFKYMNAVYNTTKVYYLMMQTWQ